MILNWTLYKLSVIPSHLASDLTWASTLEPVHEAVGYASAPGPGVDVRALLAGPHVPHPALVPQVAHLGFVTPWGAVLQSQVK